MKKRLLILFVALFLSACADKNQYEATVLAEMQKEQDIKDYKLDPQIMTDCVIDLTSQKMSGFFAFDPARMTAYRNYNTMLTLTQSENPKEVLAQLTKDFGSGKELFKARVIYSESIGHCLASVIATSEEQQQEDEEDLQEAPAADNS
ncbi:MAG: hypothetical protein Q9M50_06475 [Methylococcales bacterium]|nr:hypothetical protein [Methylococcales bacterium]